MANTNEERDDRRQRHDQTGVHCGRVTQAGVDAALGNREAEPADDEDWERAGAEQIEHFGHMPGDKRQEGQPGEQGAPERQGPRRHLGRCPFGGDIDAGGKQPANCTERGGGSKSV